MSRSGPCPAAAPGLHRTDTGRPSRSALIAGSVDDEPRSQGGPCPSRPRPGRSAGGPAVAGSADGAVRPRPRPRHLVPRGRRLVRRRRTRRQVGTGLHRSGPTRTRAREGIPGEGPQLHLHQDPRLLRAERHDQEGLPAGTPGHRRPAASLGGGHGGRPLPRLSGTPGMPAGDPGLGNAAGEDEAPGDLAPVLRRQLGSPATALAGTSTRPRRGPPGDPSSAGRGRTASSADPGRWRPPRLGGGRGGGLRAPHPPPAGRRVPVLRGRGPGSVPGWADRAS